MGFSGNEDRPKGRQRNLEPEICPKCGSAEVRRIAYGLPGPEMGEAAGRGEIASGGCVIDERSRQWECAACKVTFNDGGTDVLEPVDYRPEWVRRQQEGPDAPDSI